MFLNPNRIIKQLNVGILYFSIEIQFYGFFGFRTRTVKILEKMCFFESYGSHQLRSSIHVGIMESLDTDRISLCEGTHSFFCFVFNNLVVLIISRGLLVDIDGECGRGRKVPTLLTFNINSL